MFIINRVRFEIEAQNIVYLEQQVIPLAVTRSALETISAEIRNIK